MRLVIFLFLPFFITCCVSPPKVYNNYYSTCKLYNQTELKLLINPNGNFEYRFAYNNETINGTWEIIKKDTLVLKSAKFLEHRESLSPKIKMSNIEGIDKFYISKRKLYLINLEGLKKSCYLMGIKE